MGNCYKAQEASRKSLQFVMAKDKEGWLSLFADDAVVQDPVGESPLDPSGEGHKGKEAIEGFYDMVIAPGNLELEIKYSLPAGDECANVVVMQSTFPNGVVDNPMIVVYKANDEGKIVSLRAFWEFDKLAEKLAKLG